MVEEYFKAEQFQSILIILAGLVSVSSGIGIYVYYRSKLALGLIFPLAIFGLIELTVGTSVYFRSSEDIVRVNQYFEEEQENIQQIELPRMEKVMTNFTYLI